MKRLLNRRSRALLPLAAACLSLLACADDGAVTADAQDATARGGSCRSFPARYDYKRFVCPEGYFLSDTASTEETCYDPGSCVDLPAGYRLDQEAYTCPDGFFLSDTGSDDPHCYYPPAYDSFPAQYVIGAKIYVCPDGFFQADGHCYRI